MLLDWPRDDHHLGLFWAALEVSDLERATWKQEIGLQHILSHRALEKHSQARVHQKRARATSLLQYQFPEPLCLGQVGAANPANPGTCLIRDWL